MLAEKTRRDAHGFANNHHHRVIGRLGIRWTIVQPAESEAVNQAQSRKASPAR